ncbi:hypothetical protein [Longispora urticae]
MPVEVKRRHAGIDDKAIELLDKLSTAIDAPYDILAVTEPARDCTGLDAFARALPGRPRFVITDDQLMDDLPFWSLGANPFAWNPTPRRPRQGPRGQIRRHPVSLRSEREPGLHQRGPLADK